MNAFSLDNSNTCKWITLKETSQKFQPSPTIIPCEQKKYSQNYGCALNSTIKGLPSVTPAYRPGSNSRCRWERRMPVANNRSTKRGAGGGAHFQYSEHKVQKKQRFEFVSLPLKFSKLKNFWRFHRFHFNDGGLLNRKSFTAIRFFVSVEWRPVHETRRNLQRCG